MLYRLNICLQTFYLQIMKFYLIINLLWVIRSLKMCSLFSNDEKKCLSTDLDMCAWISQGLCIQTQSTSLGCHSTLSRLACRKQLVNFKGEQQLCHFANFCQPLVDPSRAQCSRDLSKHACLSVTNQQALCKWTTECQPMSAEEINTLQLVPSSTSDQNTQSKVLAVSESVSVSACLLINAYPSNTFQHIIALQVEGKCDSSSSDQLFPYLYTQCTAPGVNELLCRQITMTNQLCYFNGGRCTKLTQDSSLLYSLECSASLNKAACLAIRQTPSGNPCYWNTDDNTCSSFTQEQMSTLFTSCDSSTYLVSPSFCSAIKIASSELTACYYNTETNKCSQLCDGTGCSTLKSLDSGLNVYACMTVGQACYFDGICRQTTRIDSMRCDEGLNKQLCLSLATEYQTCQWDTKTAQCKVFSINEQTICGGGVLVNYQSCREIVTSPCQYDENTYTCFNSDGLYVTNTCTTSGLNRIGCTSVDDGSFCQWDGTKCVVLVLTYEEECNSLKDVNPQTCSQVFDTKDKYCRYNSKTSSCYEFTDMNDLTGLDSMKVVCTTPGLNFYGCMAVTELGWGCHWNDDDEQCERVIEGSESCETVYGANPMGCRIAGKDGEGCAYDTDGYCTSEIDTTWKCSEHDINADGCSLLSDSCYWNREVKLCQPTTQDILKSIGCKDYPTKTACLAITTVGQFCFWDTSNTSCESFIISPSDECKEGSKQVNENVCRKIGSFSDGRIDCTSKSTKGSCEVVPDTFTFSKPCSGPSQVINLVACVQRSNTESKQCYFNLDPGSPNPNPNYYACQEITAANEAVLSTIDCYQANKATCVAITNKKCFWDTASNFCVEATDMVKPDNKSSAPQPQFSATYCASLSKQAIKWNPDTFACDEIGALAVSDLLSCETKGINEIGCRSKTASYCSFDSTTYICFKAGITQCTLKYNQNACLQIASPEYQGLCSWDAVKNECTYNACNVIVQNDGCFASTQTCEWKNSKCQVLLSLTSCSNTYNKAACVSSKNPAKCIFSNDVCSDQNDPKTIPNCTTPTYTNDGSYCGKIEGQMCSYVTDHCELFSEINDQTSCNIVGINKAGCLSLGNKLQCVWDPVGFACADYDISKDYDCTDKVSQELCLSLAYAWTPKLCIFDTETKTCKKPTADMSCTDRQLISIDAGDICSQATSQVNKGCILSTDRCIEVDTIGDCEGSYVNKQGCGLSTKQTCKWDNSQCVLQSPQSCEEIQYEKYCLNNQYLACKWDEHCVTLDFIHSCQVTLFKVSAAFCVVLSDKSCKYDESLNKCIPGMRPSKCIEATNVIDCLAIEFCYFNAKTLNCIDIRSSYGALTCTDAHYSQLKDCLSITKSDSYCTYVDKSALCHPADIYSLKCTDLMTPQTCARIRTVGQYCQLVDKTCTNANLSTVKCSDSVNIHACLSSTSANCLWTQSKCVDGSSDPSDQPKLVSQQFCQKLTEFQTKWNSKYYTCDSPVESDECLTPGLNKLGCVNRKEACRWSGSSCQQFAQTTQVACADYIDVSAKVCQLIEGLSCRYDEEKYKCVDFTTSDGYGCDEPGLSKLACVQVLTEPCSWQDSQCSFQNITAITQCVPNEDSFDALSTVSNAVSCSLINYGDQICKYDTQLMGCVASIDYTTDDCNTPGLNLFGCSAIQLSQCQVEDGICVKLESTTDLNCSDLVQVGPQICSEATDTACKYSQSQFSCVESSTYDKCLAIGLNKKGCQLLSDKKCVWYNDLGQCSCKSLSGTNCPTLKTEAKCQLQSNCKWDSEACRRIKCSDIASKESCSGVIDGMTCYYSGSCKEAITCSDVSDTVVCPTISIEGENCFFSSTTQRCQVKQCSDLSECTPTVLLNGQICASREVSSSQTCSSVSCDELSETECSASQDAYCFWIQEKCQQLPICEAVNDLSNGQELCKSLKIKGNQCVWGPDDILSSVMKCHQSGCRQIVSQLQSIFSYTESICQGREVFGQVCTMVGQFCFACEEITDPCVCETQNGLCSYDGEQCRSITCNTLNKKLCDNITYKSRCALTQGKCGTQCASRSDAECKKTKNCEWNGITNVCQDVQNSEFSLDPMMKKLISQAIGQSIVMFGFLTMLLIWVTI